MVPVFLYYTFIKKGQKNITFVRKMEILKIYTITGMYFPFFLWLELVYEAGVGLQSLSRLRGNNF